MRTRICSILMLCALAAGLLPLPGLALEQQDTLRRFALIIGANNGGNERPRLHYAISDAKAMLQLLQKIGGVFPIDCVLVLDPDREAFLKGIQTMQEKIRAAKASAKKTELVFYYSGHSDEEAVLLGQEKIPYQEIKRAIDQTPADVRIAILDSCSSGAFTRLKGGKVRPPFLMDASYDMHGYAFLTSSSSDEGSQESDRLQSSFFTHYLISGLRGAADMAQDGRVTLNEAYQYAYRETLVKTEKTLGGPQHPNYDIQMTGTGDVVMTDIRNSSAILTLSESLSGHIFIRDANDYLVIEMRKPAGHPMQIGLEEGAYTISNERDQKLYETSLTLALGQDFHLAPDQFHEVARERTLSRGDSEPEDKFNDSGYEVVPWAFIFYPDPEKYRQTIHYYVMGILGTYSAKLDGLALSLGPNIISENSRGAQISAIADITGRETEGAQIAGLYTIAHGKVKGIQYAGIFTIADGNLSGVQYSGVFDICRGKMRGVQYTSVFSLAGDDLFGVQASGVFNLAQQNVTGGQAAGVFCHTGGNLTGVQFAGVYNYAGGNLTGCQASSIVNICQDCQGLQLGLVNIAREQQGLPLGLVNFSKNGGIDLVAWKDNITDYNLGVKFRAGYFYTLLAANTRLVASGWDQAAGGSFYYGGHFPLGPAYVEVDMGYALVNHPPMRDFDEHNAQSAQARVTVGATWDNRISVFVGSGVSYTYQGKNVPAAKDMDSTWVMTNEKYEPILQGGMSLTF